MTSQYCEVQCIHCKHWMWPLYECYTCVNIFCAFFDVQYGKVK